MKHIKISLILALFLLSACVQNDINNGNPEQSSETKNEHTTEASINNSESNLGISNNDKPRKDNQPIEIEYLTFQDKRLENKIINYLKENKIINNDTRKIKKESLSKIKKLDLKTCGLINLDDLSQFQYLEYIDLSNYEFMEEMGFFDDFDSNKINDLTPLRNLNNINHLDLSNLNKNNQKNLAESKNIAIISKLTKLEYLDISNTGIQDISFLKNNPNLKVLKVNGNDIEDFSVLEQLKNLEIIEMKHNNIKSVDIITKLEHLKEIKILGNNAIKDYELLNNISDKVNVDVKYDFIADNTVVDINNEEAKEFIKKEADINGDDIKKSDLASITSLYLPSCQIQDISWIKHFVNLVEFRLGDQSISDISSFENLNKLKFLDISYNDIQDINCVRNMENLTELIAYDNLIEDIRPIIENDKIKECDITKNRIQAIDCLRDRKAPLRLDVRQNPLEKNDEIFDNLREIRDGLNEEVYIELDIP
ncbi:MAG: leucine-rich repeat domain-containing protein [Clostridia bacterium]|nr:leucine-rich repeat domain-containing protein [Clostridia bacterium]